MITTILRYLIALIFIASGFVKAVDPVGFSFKLEEYFSPGVFNMPFLESFALPLAILVCFVEVVLGLMLLLKFKLRLTLILLIALCVFFGFLTFYSAYFNVVTDCGCFGDALKMTPWQSFWKDIALLIGLLILWFATRKQPETENKNNLRLMILGLGIAITVFYLYSGIRHEPLIDFRAYKIGTNLNAEKQKIAENPSVYKTFYVLKNTKTGEEKKVNQDDYVNDKTFWEEGTPWEIQEDQSTSEITHQGYASEISKLRIEDLQGNDITDTILKAEKAVLVFSYHPKNLTPEEVAQSVQVIQNHPFSYGISTHPDTFPNVPNAMLDGTAIKTIARSNPFVLTLEKGIIKDKKSLQDYLKNK